MRYEILNSKLFIITNSNIIKMCYCSFFCYFAACADCKIGWGKWGECSNGERLRFEIIQVQPVGAGEPCPELRKEREICVDCEVQWRKWGECYNGMRRRMQYVSIEPIGAGRVCDPLSTEIQRKHVSF